MKYLVTANVSYELTFAIEAEPEDGSGRNDAIQSGVRHMISGWGGFGNGYGWFSDPKLVGYEYERATEDDDHYPAIPPEVLKDTNF